MIYQFVKCPNFVHLDANGSVQSLQCKLCGAVIADTVDREVGMEMSRGGQLIKIVRRQLMRFDNYCEIKIAFDDPLYFHVTHGCNKCLSINMPLNVLAEMHAVDQAESPDGYTDRERSKTPVGVIVFKTDQSGIV